MFLTRVIPRFPLHQWFRQALAQFTVLDKDGNSFKTNRSVLDKDGNAFTVSGTVLDTDGNGFTVI
jgi:hypothetical protein